MKNALLLLAILFITFACNSTKKVSNAKTDAIAQTQVGDTIKLSGDNLEYDVIIIEPGFGTYLNSIAKPEGFYSQNYLENKNTRFVQEWNSRVLQPSRYNSNLYEMQINYSQGVDYGYQVNYKIYNYFIYFQNKYKQNLLGSRIPQN